MVFPGRLSTGCYLCRKRKVKCDDTKPACRRCITHGTPCPGYPDPFAFRSYQLNEQKTTSRKSKSGWIFENVTTASGDRNSNRSRNKDAPPVIKQPTEPSKEWQALCYFFHHYVLRVDKSPCRGYLVFLPELYQERADDACLRDALLSVSYLALFKSTGAKALKVNAYNHYGVALSGLVEALNSKKLSMKEETLTIALFLSMFKDMSHEGNNFVNPHVPGICSLLQSWGQQQLSTKYGREVFGWALTQIQIQAMATNQFRYAALPPSIQSIEQPDTVCLAGIITSKISEFCELAIEMRKVMGGQSLASDSAFETNFQSLFHRAARILQYIDQWEARLPKHWKLQMITLASSPGSIQPSTLGVSHDPWTTCFLAVFYAAQIYFYLEIQNISMISAQFDRFIQKFFTGPQLDLDSRIQNSVNQICTTLTRTLGNLDDKSDFTLLGQSKLATGHTLSWPLSIVINCGYASPEKTDLCRKALSSIGSEMQFNLASSLSMSSSLGMGPGMAAGMPPPIAV